MATTYGPARTRQLRALLWVSLVLAGLLLMVSVFALVVGPRQFGFVVGVPALVGTALATAAVRDGTNARLRLLSLGSGVCQAVLGVLLAASALGILPSIVGILLLLVALLPGVAGDTAD
jgi:hypothetical protein